MLRGQDHKRIVTLGQGRGKRCVTCAHAWCRSGGRRGRLRGPRDLIQLAACANPCRPWCPSGLVRGAVWVRPAIRMGTVPLSQYPPAGRETHGRARPAVAHDVPRRCRYAIPCRSRSSLRRIPDSGNRIPAATHLISRSKTLPLAFCLIDAVLCALAALREAMLPFAVTPIDAVLCALAALREAMLPFAVTQIDAVLGVLSAYSACSGLRSVAVAVCRYPDSGRSQRSLRALRALSVKICRRCRSIRNARSVLGPIVRILTISGPHPGFC